MTISITFSRLEAEGHDTRLGEYALNFETMETKLAKAVA